jgi:hypothetical protein
MIFTLHTAVALVEPWARVYRDHNNVSAAVAFLHLGGLLAAGGFAIAADRGRSAPSPAMRHRAARTWRSSARCTGRFCSGSRSSWRAGC